MQRIAVIGFTGQGGALAVRTCKRLRENGYMAEGYAGAAAARQSGLLPAEGGMWNCCSSAPAASPCAALPRF